MGKYRKKEKYRPPKQHKLKRLLRQNFITQTEIAEMLGIGNVTLHLKLEGKSIFRLHEAMMIAERLGMSVEEIFRY